MNQSLIARIKNRLRRFIFLKVEEHVCVSNLTKSTKKPRLADNEQQLFLDTPALVEEHRGQIPTELFEEFKRRAASAVGVLHLVDGKLATYLWVTDKSMDNEGVEPFTHRVDLKCGETYVFDAFTYPEYRNTRAFYKLSLGLLQHLKKSGYKAVFIIFDSKNPSWINFYARLGFELVGNLSFRRVLGFASSDTSVIDGSQDRPREAAPVLATAS